MKLFISIIIVITVFACNDVAVNLEGEWLMKGENGNETIILVNADSSGMFFSDGHREPFMIKEISKETLTVVQGDDDKTAEKEESTLKLLRTAPQLLTFQYKLNDDELFLKEIKSGEEFIWYKCENNYAVKEKIQYLKLGLSRLELSIPEVDGNETKPVAINGKESILFIGKPYAGWVHFSGKGFKITDGNAFLENNYIIFSIEKQLIEKEEIESPTVLLFVDKSTPMQKLFELKSILENYKSLQIQLALKRKKSGENGYEFLKIEKIIDLTKKEEMKMSFEEWVK